MVSDVDVDEEEEVVDVPLEGNEVSGEEEGPE